MGASPDDDSRDGVVEGARVCNLDRSREDGVVSVVDGVVKIVVVGGVVKVGVVVVVGIVVFGHSHL